MTYGKFEKLFVAKITEWLNEQGYFWVEKTRGVFEKKGEHYNDLIIMGRGYSRWPAQYCFSVGGCRRLNGLENLVAEFKTRHDGLDYTISAERGQNGIMRKCFQPETENLIEVVMQYVAEQKILVLGELDRLSDLKLLNELENKSFQHNGFVKADDFWMRKLALAWSVQAPIYEDLYTNIYDMYIKIIASKDEYQDEYIREFASVKNLYAKLSTFSKL